MFPRLGVVVCGSVDVAGYGVVYWFVAVAVCGVGVAEALLGYEGFCGVADCGGGPTGEGA